MGFQNLQGQQFHNISGQPVPGLSCPSGGFSFPCLKSEPLLFMMTVSSSHTVQFSEEPGSVFSVTTLQVLAGCA